VKTRLYSMQSCNSCKRATFDRTCRLWTRSRRVPFAVADGVPSSSCDSVADSSIACSGCTIILCSWSTESATSFCLDIDNNLSPKDEYRDELKHLSVSHALLPFITRLDVSKSNCYAPGFQVWGGAESYIGSATACLISLAAASRRNSLRFCQIHEVNTSLQSTCLLRESCLNPFNPSTHVIDSSHVPKPEEGDWIVYSIINLCQNCDWPYGIGNRPGPTAGRRSGYDMVN